MNTLPYHIPVRRGSASTSTPLSDAERMSLPAACLNVSTLSGRSWLRHASLPSRSLRSSEMGSVGGVNGRRGITTQRNVSPWASNPSQNDLSAKSDEVFSAMKCSEIRRTLLFRD